MRARSGSALADPGFTRRVMAAVEQDEMLPANVVSIDTAKPRHGRVTRRTGWAIAASVAVASLATVSVVLAPGAEDEPVLVARDVPTAAAIPVQERGIQPAVQTSGAAPRGPVAQPTEAAATVRWSQMEPDAAQQLNGYLINHSRYRAGPGVGGTLGYARVASVNGEPVEASTSADD